MNSAVANQNDTESIEFANEFKNTWSRLRKSVIRNAVVMGLESGLFATFAASAVVGGPALATVAFMTLTGFVTVATAVGLKQDWKWKADLEKSLSNELADLASEQGAKTSIPKSWNKDTISSSVSLVQTNGTLNRLMTRVQGDYAPEQSTYDAQPELLEAQMQANIQRSKQTHNLTTSDGVSDEPSVSVGTKPGMKR